jgi:hypothetical protein
VMKTILFIGLSIPVAAGLTVIWWRLWMNHGILGPPPFLRPFLFSDGEGAYDRVAVEMFIVLWLLMLAAIWLIRLRWSSEM